MAETLLAGGGALVVAWWLTRPPVGAPLWTWQAWRLPDLAATYEHMRLRSVGDGLPVRRHDGTGRPWPDQGTSADVADVAAIRSMRDLAWARPVAVGAAGLAVAGVAARPLPVDMPRGLIASDRVLVAADVERIKARFRASAHMPATVLTDSWRVEPVDAPAPSDVMALDLIEARLSAGLSNVVAAAYAALMEGVTA